MNRGIRRVGLALVACFVALAGQLTYLQVIRADDLSNDPANVRARLRDLNRPRGPIVTQDGFVLAETVEVPGGDVTQRRIYPEGSLFGHVTGFVSIVFGTTGVEDTYRDELLGRTLELRLDPSALRDFLSPEAPTGTVVLTLTREAQVLARDALAGRRGSVVVVDVRTGGVVAMYSNPTYDPNPLAALDADAVIAARAALDDDPAQPELARAYRERYPPGSVFKIVTTGIALDTGTATPETVFPSIRELDLPQTDRTLSNFGGSQCGGTLAESFRRSCNTTFAALGLELGEQLAVGVEDYGLNVDPPPLDLRPGAARSVGPERGTFELAQPTFAQAAIGQGPVFVTPLQMALVSAAVANGGSMPVPHVMDRVENGDGAVVDRYSANEWRRSMSEQAAADITAMMVDVVAAGTGTAAQIPGITVAGKTGTAQAPGGDPHAWFTAFAPAEDPRYAIAVIVERGGDLGSEATGGRVAAPIAAQVLGGLLGG